MLLAIHFLAIIQLIASERFYSDLNDQILTKRCFLKQLNIVLEETHLKNCKTTLMKSPKPGSCSQINKNTTDIPVDVRRPCIDSDHECPDTDKCCSNECHSVVGMDLIPLSELPPIPVNFTIFPWSSVNTDDGDHIEYKIQWETKYVPEYITSYLIQARQHYNDYFHHYHYPQSEWYELLADIYSQTNDKTTGNISIKALVKFQIGKWYQIRIAAVNMNGIRGFSQPLLPFHVKSKIFDPDSVRVIQPPKNFTLSHPVFLRNSSIYCLASWLPPNIEPSLRYKYRLSWALHLKADDSSLYYEHIALSKRITSYKLMDLKPNSTYLVQIKVVPLQRYKRIKSIHAQNYLYTNNATHLNEILLKSNYPEDDSEESEVAEIVVKQKNNRLIISWQNTIRNRSVEIHEHELNKLDGNHQNYRVIKATGHRIILHHIKPNCVYTIILGTAKKIIFIDKNKKLADDKNYYNNY